MPSFSLNSQLLENAREILANHPRVFWILGGAGAGKSTLCRALAEQYGIAVYEMDAQIYGAWRTRYDALRHPVNRAWLDAPNPLQFLLHLTWQVFDAFNAASNAEYLDLFAQDIQAMDANTPLLVDGGLSKPSVLIQGLPARQIVCLAIPEKVGTHIWETAPERQFMQDMVRQLPDGETMWQKFLQFDRQLSRTMVLEARANEIRVFTRTEAMSVEELVREIVEYFDISSADFSQET